MYKYITLLTIISNFAFSTEKPKWTILTPIDTAEKLFFVGRSPKVQSEFEGIRMAAKDAKEQLLRQEFGTTVKIDTVQKETLTSVELQSELNEISDLILLKGFKQDELFVNKNSDESLEVWVLFSVPKQMLTQEKERVELLKKQKMEFNSEVYLSSISKVFDNGGKPKLIKGMKKSQVIALFGKPIKADSTSFDFESSEFCEQGLNGPGCTVWFDEGKVSHWYQFKAENTTDLDDEPAVISKKITAPKRAVNSKKQSKNKKSPEQKKEANQDIENNSRFIPGYLEKNKVTTTYDYTIPNHSTGIKVLEKEKNQIRIASCEELEKGILEEKLFPLKTDKFVVIDKYNDLYDTTGEHLLEILRAGNRLDLNETIQLKKYSYRCDNHS